MTAALPCACGCAVAEFSLAVDIDVRRLLVRAENPLPHPTPARHDYGLDPLAFDELDEVEDLR